MPIDLPAGTQPALATTQEIRNFQQTADDAAQTPIRTQHAGYDITVLGNRQLSEEEVTAALRRGDNLSNAVWQLHFAYMQAGHRLTRLRYFLDGTRLHITVIEGHIAEIEGPASLTRYFWEVENRQFELPRLEASRTLANLQAGRLGLEAQSYYEPVAESSPQTRLRIEAVPAADYRRLRYSLETGNPGNRFVGRYFARGEAVLDTRPAQWKLNLNKALSGLDDDGDREGDLESYQLSASSVIPIGLLAGGLSNTDYHYTGRSGNEFIGDISQAQLLMQEIAYADIDQRNLLTQRLIFVDSTIRERSSRQAVIDERYFAAELGVEQTRRIRLWRYQPTLALKIQLRKGLSDNSGTLGTETAGVRRDARFLTLLPSAELRFRLQNDWQLKLQAASQYADRQVPEQQQWILGGTERLRAWLPGALLGDEGHYLNAELRVAQYVWRNWSLQPSLFVEAGSSRLKASTAELSGRQYAYDAGLGLEIKQGERWRLELLAAEPLSSPELNTAVSEGGEASLFFKLQLNW